MPGGLNFRRILFGSIAHQQIGRLRERCVECDYDLSATRPNEKCPECGADRTRVRDTSRLHEARPDQIRKIRFALLLLVIGSAIDALIILAIAAPAAFRTDAHILRLGLAMFLIIGAAMMHRVIAAATIASGLSFLSPRPSWCAARFQCWALFSLDVMSVLLVLIATQQNDREILEASGLFMVFLLAPPRLAIIGMLHGDVALQIMTPAVLKSAHLLQRMARVLNRSTLGVIVGLVICMILRLDSTVDVVLWTFLGWSLLVVSLTCQLWLSARRLRAELRQRPGERVSGTDAEADDPTPATGIDRPSRGDRS